MDPVAKTYLTLAQGIPDFILFASTMLGLHMYTGKIPAKVNQGSFVHNIGQALQRNFSFLRN